MRWSFLKVKLTEARRGPVKKTASINGIEQDAIVLLFIVKAPFSPANGEDWA
jgi:hypothetical protein